MIQAGAVVMTAREYLGTPFVHQGRSKSGVDCVGLLICTVRDLGLTTPAEIPYSRRPDGDLVKRLRQHLRRGDLCPYELTPGMVVSIRLPIYPCHVAVVTEPNRIIHALASTGRVIEQSLNDAWYDRIVESYFIPGVFY